MSSLPVVFHRVVLEKYLSSIAIDAIPDYGLKHKEMLKWKSAVASGNLEKTKEMSVQGKFLESVFEKVLGYNTFLEGSEIGEYNQIQECKTEGDRTASDSALGFFSADKKVIRAVIELKDATTKLDERRQSINFYSPVEQGFSYAHKNGSGCRWVIISNFVEIRLYRSSSSLEYEKFLITELDKEAEFKRFYALLCKDSLLGSDGKSPVDKLYDNNELAIGEISSEFYCKYKALRKELFQALKANNENYDDLKLFEVAQKILDRTIFIAFCENNGLIEAGAFRETIEIGKKSRVQAPHRVWDQLCGLFNSIDKGNPDINIHGYNGGLFKGDPELDSLALPDKPLVRLAELFEYDFGSDLNVNILGHIFEQSISDQEQIKAEIMGAVQEKKRGRQKAEGIFYTPRYVTQYIVKQTIGRLLADKRRLFGLDSLPSLTTADFSSIKNVKGKISYSQNIAKHVRAWEIYRDFIYSIKVLDPACGSGAFLNEVFDYLSAEGRAIQHELEKLLKGNVTATHIGSEVLANNIYGVDMARESVEITKLSLWLKTANKYEQLINLDDNIKAGNSIIKDHTIAGDLAFDWHREFADIMANGGFDVVLGNPPYGADLSQAEKDYIADNYETTEYNFDTYKTFMELGLKLTKQDGYMGYITPNTYFVLEKGATKLRKFLFENYTLVNVAELFNVFPTAVVEPAISVYKKRPPNAGDKLEVISLPRNIELTSTFISDGTITAFTQSDLRQQDGYIFNFRETEDEKRIIEKIIKLSKPLSDFFSVSAGVKPYEKGKGLPPQTQEIVNSKPYEGYEKVDDTWLPYIRGKTIGRYTDEWDGEYIKYGEWLAAPRTQKMFQNEKIFIRQTGDYPIATFDATGKIGKNTTHCIYSSDGKSPVSLMYLLGLINSKLMKWVFQHENFHIVGKPLAENKKIYVERFPIVAVPDQRPLISLVERLLENCQARHDMARQFISYIKSVHSPKSVSEKLSEFYRLNFKDFIDELKKQKVELSPKQEMELLPLFEEKAEEIARLSNLINALDYEVDHLVYSIYGLENSEIAIIESVICEIHTHSPTPLQLLQSL
ncbi:MAG: BREX-1 system adenine-specific DNA-methyltransferase PglX [Holophagaceae bacterium]|nr:BREX-1 system adenine-specific DNA-methyltransferase PglX [Holophagaceae bacterium]